MLFSIDHILSKKKSVREQKEIGMISNVCFNQNDIKLEITARLKTKSQIREYEATHFKNLYLFVKSERQRDLLFTGWLLDTCKRQCQHSLKPGTRGRSSIPVSYIDIGVPVTWEIFCSFSQVINGNLDQKRRSSDTNQAGTAINGLT